MCWCKISPEKLCTCGKKSEDIHQPAEDKSKLKDAMGIINTSYLNFNEENNNISEESPEQENVIDDLIITSSSNESVIDSSVDKGSCFEMIVGDFEGKTKILHLMNGGSFGEIYLGECLTTNKKVAVKAEKQRQGYEKLLHEGNVYYKLQGGPGIPKVYWYGMHGSSYNFLVMELLGPSLSDIFHQQNNKFSLKTVLKFQVEILDVLKYMHNLNYIHRDISPNNFVIGLGEHRSKVYLIDFGLAKKCNEAGRRVLQGRRNSYSFKRPMVGTPRFVSLGVHQGTPEGRQDDLESLAYISIFFLKGSLPWQGSHSSKEGDKFAQIAESKTMISPTDLCSGIPAEFVTFLEYTRSLRPTDMPDYDGLVNLFEVAAYNANIDLKTVTYDWED